MRRRIFDLSQRELAARAGIGEKHLGEIERGLRDPRLSTVLRLLDALDLPPIALLRRWEAERRIERTAEHAHADPPFSTGSEESAR